MQLVLVLSVAAVAVVAAVAAVAAVAVRSECLHHHFLLCYLLIVNCVLLITKFVFAFMLCCIHKEINTIVQRINNNNSYNNNKKVRCSKR